MMDYKDLAASVGPRIGATQEWVYQVLRQGIISGALPGGMQLKQDEISAALNVSHIPVREALRQLEAQGLVHIQPNRGASVTQLSRAMLEDMMEIRAYISSSILATAVPMMTDEDFDEMDALLAEQEKETELFRVEQLNYRFHELLTRRANNVVADILIEIIHANIDRYLRSSFYATADKRDTSIEGHRAILNACRARDAVLASKLLREHILDAKINIPADMQ